MKFVAPVVILMLIVIGGITACFWAVDQFTPSKFSLAEIADFPNIAARKYVVLEMLKRLDAAGSGLTLDKLKQIVHEPMVNVVSNQDGLTLRTQNPNLGWQVEASENCEKVIVGWEPSKCAIKIVDIRGLFGPAKVIQPDQIPETHNPAMMVFKKMWGHILIAVDQDQPGHNNGFAKCAFFSRDTLTPDARRARLFRTGDWAVGREKTSF